MKAEENILQVKDKIQKISVMLKEKRSKEKSTTVSTQRLVSHHKSLEIDHVKRPSDQYWDIRAYSKMDKDMWALPDMCEWFNKNATDTPSDYKASGETGFMLRVDN